MRLTMRHMNVLSTYVTLALYHAHVEQKLPQQPD